MTFLLRDTHGRDMAFVEKKDYVPEVNIEYVDDHGRLLTAKEVLKTHTHTHTEYYIITVTLLVVGI